MTAGRSRRAVVDAFGQPALLGCCALLGVLELGTWLVVAPFLVGTSLPAAVGWLLVQRLLSFAVLAAVLPGCYATARERLGLRSAIEAVADRASADGPGLFGSIVAARALLVGLWICLLVLAFTLLGWIDTAAVWTDAYLGVGLDRELLALVGVPAAVAGTALLAHGAVGLYDVRFLEAAGHPARTPLWSVGAWRGRGRALPAYAVVRSVLVATPLAAALLTLVVASPGIGLSTAPSPVAVALAAVALVGATTFSRAVLVAYQLATRDWIERREPAPAVAVEGGDTDNTDVADVANDTDEGDDATGSLRPHLPQRRRTVLAAVLVLAAIVGVGGIRALDVHPAPTDSVDVAPGNATASIEAAVERTDARDGITEQRVDTWNASATRWDVLEVQALLDRTDRQARVHTGGGGADLLDGRTMYANDGRLAMLRSPDPPAPPRAYFFTLERGSWTALVGPAYDWVVDETLHHPSPDADWSLVEATDDRLVYRVDDPDEVADTGMGPFPAVPPEDDATVGEDTGATVVIDRSIHTIRRANASLDVRRTGRDGETERVRQRWERATIKLGDVDVRRPGSLPPPSLPALLWDVVYY